MTIKRFSHIGICVSDLAQSIAFYRDALGFKEQYGLTVGSEVAGIMEMEDNLSLRSFFLERDGTRIELLYYDAPGHTGPAERRPMNQLGLTHLGVRVDDVDAVLEGVRRAGGHVIEATRTKLYREEDRAEMEFVYTTDPDGTRVELIQMPDPPSQA